MTTQRGAASIDPMGDRRLLSVLESIGDAYFALDRDWRVVMFNPAAEAFFGVSRDNVVGGDFWAFYGAGQDTDYAKLLRRAMSEGASAHLTMPFRTRAGRVVDVRISPVEGVGVGVSTYDVTERTEAEAALRRSQERLDLAVGAHSIGIFDWHLPSGQVVWSGEQAQIFGYGSAPTTRPIDLWRALLPPDDMARIDALLTATIAARGERLTFEFRINRPDGMLRWVEGAARLLYEADGTPLRMVGTNIDITERKASDQRQQLLINELNHRVKNALAIVQSIARQSFRADSASAAAREAFEGRLMALAAAHDVLTRQNWTGATLDQIMAEATAPHSRGDGRLSAAGPRVDLEPKTAVALGLAAHELATNAVKYGALSSPDGRVDIYWEVDGEMLRLTWREQGGPPVVYDGRRGFGARLLEQGLAEELRGSVKLDFRPEGLVCRMVAMLGAPAA